MAIVEFDTCAWSDPWMQELSPVGKLLFIYLWTNSHKNVACIYPISYKTIKDETGLDQKKIEDTLSILYPKVIYDSEKHIVFVVNHVRRQFMRTGNISPKIIQAIIKCLMTLPKGHPFIFQFINEYSELQIEYPYPIDTLSKGYDYTLQVKGVRCKVKSEECKDSKVEKEKKIKRDIPLDFGISERVTKWAEKKGYTRLEEHLEAFKRKVAMKGYQYIDWDAAFMEAVRENWSKIGANNGTERPQNAGGGRETREQRKRRYAAEARKNLGIRSRSSGIPDNVHPSGVGTEGPRSVDSKIIEGTAVETEET